MGDSQSHESPHMVTDESDNKMGYKKQKKHIKYSRSVKQNFNIPDIDEPSNLPQPQLQRIHIVKEEVRTSLDFLIDESNDTEKQNKDNRRTPKEENFTKSTIKKDSNISPKRSEKYISDEEIEQRLYSNADSSNISDYETAFLKNASGFDKHFLIQEKKYSSKKHYIPSNKKFSIPKFDDRANRSDSSTKTGISNQSQELKNEQEEKKSSFLPHCFYKNKNQIKDTHNSFQIVNPVKTAENNKSVTNKQTMGKLPTGNSAASYSQSIKAIVIDDKPYATILPIKVIDNHENQSNYSTEYSLKEHKAKEQSLNNYSQEKNDNAGYPLHTSQSKMLLETSFDPETNIKINQIKSQPYNDPIYQLTNTPYGTIAHNKTDASLTARNTVYSLKNKLVRKDYCEPLETAVLKDTNTVKTNNSVKNTEYVSVSKYIKPKSYFSDKRSPSSENPFIKKQPKVYHGPNEMYHAKKIEYVDKQLKIKFGSEDNYDQKHDLEINTFSLEPQRELKHVQSIIYEKEIDIKIEDSSLKNNLNNELEVFNTVEKTDIISYSQKLNAEPFKTGLNNLPLVHEENNISSAFNSHVSAQPAQNLYVSENKNLIVGHVKRRNALVDHGADFPFHINTIPIVDYSENIGLTDKFNAKTYAAENFNNIKLEDPMSVTNEEKPELLQEETVHIQQETEKKPAKDKCLVLDKQTNRRINNSNSISEIENLSLSTKIYSNVDYNTNTLSTSVQLKIDQNNLGLGYSKELNMIYLNDGKTNTYVDKQGETIPDSKVSLGKNTDLAGKSHTDKTYLDPQVEQKHSQSLSGSNYDVQKYYIHKPDILDFYLN